MIGNRIKYFRKRNGLSQKQFGELLGFSKDNADIRLSQYEKETRKPKDDLICKMASVLHISPAALKAPNINNEFGVLHTLFVLEDKYGLQIETTKPGLCLSFNPSTGTENINIRKLLVQWKFMRRRYDKGDISKEEYDYWRYNLE